MTNGEKFKTAQERAEAFRIFCGEGKCEKCQFQEDHFMNSERCRFLWLDLEAEEEKPLPCPFCGGDTHIATYGETENNLYIECDNCGYYSASGNNSVDVIAAHNRVAKAVKESEAKE